MIVRIECSDEIPHEWLYHCPAILKMYSVNGRKMGMEMFETFNDCVSQHSDDLTQQLVCPI